MDRIAGLVEAAVASAGCEVWDLTLSGPRGRQLLRVFIDAPGGVDLERCTRVSRTLRPMLDASPGLAEVDLEVSSPGAERPLRGIDDYRRYVGSRVNVRFRSGGGSEGEVDDAETVVEGRLTQVDDSDLVVEVSGDRAVAIPLGAVLAARLAVDFGGDDRPRPSRKKR